MLQRLHYEAVKKASESVCADEPWPPKNRNGAETPIDSPGVTNASFKKPPAYDSTVYISPSKSKV